VNKTTASDAQLANCILLRA